MIIITRKQHWADPSGHVIEIVEWEALLRDLKNPSRIGYSERKKYRDLYMMYLPFESKIHWVEDRIEIQSRNENAVFLAFHFAYLLNAQVQGELGQVYYLDYLNRIATVWPEIATTRLRHEQLESKKLRRTRASLVIVAVVAALLFVVGSYPSYEQRRTKRQEQGMTWEEWKKQHMQELQSAAKE